MSVFDDLTATPRVFPGRLCFGVTYPVSLTPIPFRDWRFLAGYDLDHNSATIALAAAGVPRLLIRLIHKTAQIELAGLAVGLSERSVLKTDDGEALERLKEKARAHGVPEAEIEQMSASFSKASTDQGGSEEDLAAGFESLVAEYGWTIEQLMSHSPAQLRALSQLAAQRRIRERLVAYGDQAIAGSMNGKAMSEHYNKIQELADV